METQETKSELQSTSYTATQVMTDGIIVKALYIGDLRYSYESGKTPLFIYNELDRTFEMDCDPEISYPAYVVVEDNDFILLRFRDHQEEDEQHYFAYSKVDFITDYELIRED